MVREGVPGTVRERDASMEGYPRYGNHRSIREPSLVVLEKKDKTLGEAGSSISREIPPGGFEVSGFPPWEQQYLPKDYGWYTI